MVSLGKWIQDRTCAAFAPAWPFIFLYKTIPLSRDTLILINVGLRSYKCLLSEPMAVDNSTHIQFRQQVQLCLDPMEHIVAVVVVVAPFIATSYRFSAITIFTIAVTIII